MKNQDYDCLLLSNQLCFPIYLCSKELIRKYTPLLSKLDLTYTQYVVMMYFWEKKISNVKELGNVLLLDSSTLTPVLKKLESKGYLERNRNKDDERNLIITLTKQGEKLKEKALSVPDEMRKCLNIDEKEAEKLYEKAMSIITKAIKDKLKNPFK